MYSLIGCRPSSVFCRSPSDHWRTQVEIGRDLLLPPLNPDSLDIQPSASKDSKTEELAGLSVMPCGSRFEEAPPCATSAVATRIFTWRPSLFVLPEVPFLSEENAGTYGAIF